MKTSSRLLPLLLLLATAVACDSAKSSNPLTASVAGPIPGVNISAPKLLEPGSGWRLDSTDQPLTLLLENSITSGVRPLTYTIEMATDAAFGNKVFARTGVESGDSGRTSLRLPDRLSGGRTYYWRAQANDGVNTSAYSQAADFNLFIPIVIGTPSLLAPINNAVTGDTHPRFSLGNAPTSGPVVAMAYTLEIATDPGFNNRVAVWMVNEQPNQTNLDAPVNLGYSTQYFWRAIGTDSTGAIGGWSGAQAFQTPAPPVVAPPQPAPGPGPSPGAPCVSRGTALGIVQCRRSQFGTPMSSDQHVSFLRGVANDLNAAGIAPGSFGVLRKSGGANCGGLSCDVICSGQGGGQMQWDVLGDSEGSAVPLWSGPHTAPNIRIDACIAP